MYKLTAAIITATLFTASAAPAAASKGAFGQLTAGYSPATGQYCIRSGWRSGTWQSDRIMRAGECRTSEEWRERGVLFDGVPVARHQPIRAPEHLAAR